MTYDVCLVSQTGPRSIAKQVLVFTDPDAADEVADAINAVAGSLFQADGLRAEVVPGHRDGSEAVPVATSWSMGTEFAAAVEPDGDDEDDGERDPDELE